MWLKQKEMEQTVVEQQEVVVVVVAALLHVPFLTYDATVSAFQC